jgi:hypothetical protein
VGRPRRPLRRLRRRQDRPRHDFLAAGKTPQGFDLAALEADLAAVTADAAVPAEGNAAGAEATTVAQDPGGFTWNG